MSRQSRKEVIAQKYSSTMLMCRTYAEWAQKYLTRETTRSEKINLKESDKATKMMVGKAWRIPKSDQKPYEDAFNLVHSSGGDVEQATD